MSAEGLLGRAPWTWAADGLGLALLIGYQRYFGRVFRRHPERSYWGRSNRLRRAWVQTVREGRSDILAVQTLRHWVMSATLFASTAMLIGLGIVQRALEGPDLTGLSQSAAWTPQARPWYGSSCSCLRPSSSAPSCTLPWPCATPTIRAS